MKKAVAMILTIAMLFALCACGNGDAQTTDPVSSGQATNGSAESSLGSTEKETEAPHTPTDVPASAPTQAPTETPTSCSHSWNSATCTAPKTCKTCGATEGSAVSHSWNSATCTAPKTCKTCGATEGNAVSHSWNSATCTAPKTCKTCGATEGNAVGHKLTGATCTKAATCTVCGAVGNAAGHDYEILSERGDGKNFARQVEKKCKVCGVEKTLYYAGRYEFDLEAIYKTLEDYAKNYGFRVSDSFSDLPYHQNIQKDGFIVHDSYMNIIDRNGPESMIRRGKEMIDMEYDNVKNSIYPMSTNTIHLHVSYGENASFGLGSFNLWVTLTFEEQ